MKPGQRVYYKENLFEDAIPCRIMETESFAGHVVFIVAKDKKGNLYRNYATFFVTNKPENYIINHAMFRNNYDGKVITENDLRESWKTYAQHRETFFEYMEEIKNSSCFEQIN